jgi:hypothetical protein
MTSVDSLLGRGRRTAPRRHTSLRREVPEASTRQWLGGKPRKACYPCLMCIICIDFERGALRPQEARRALREMRGAMDAAHVEEIEKKLDEAEPESSPRPGA